STTHTLTLGLTVTRTVSTGIRVSATTQPFDFTSAKGTGAADGLSAAVSMTTNVTLSYDDTADTAWVVASPSLAVDVNATPLSLTSVHAAIGILGVTLTAGSTYSASAHFVGALRDPNNDGRLTVGAGSELGTAGASSGLTTIALPASGGGTLSGTLNI